jgi:hypothetical protein
MAELKKIPLLLLLEIMAIEKYIKEYLVVCCRGKQMHRPRAECAQNAGKVGRARVPLAGQAQSLLPPTRLRLGGQVAASGG